MSERVLVVTLALALGAGVAGLPHHAGLAGRTATERTRSAPYDDHPWSRGTGDSPEVQQTLTLEELRRSYRVEERDGLLRVYDRGTGELLYVYDAPPGP